VVTGGVVGWDPTGQFVSVIMALSTSAANLKAAHASRRGWRQSSKPDRFCTTDVRASALNA
jgi:hypothetical protein